MASLIGPILQILGFIIQIFGFIAVVVSVFLAYLQIRKTHEWNRRKTSFDVSFNVASGEIKTIRTRLLLEYGVDLTDPASTYERAIAGLDQKTLHAFHNEIDALFNCLESIFLGIKHHILDEDICYEYLSWVVVSFWRWGATYICRVRKLDPTLWMEYGHFAGQWQARQACDRAAIRKPGKPRM